MTLSDFEAITHEVFGAIRAEYLVRSHVLTQLDGLTAQEALAAGVSPKRVWQELAAEFEVPEAYL